MTRSLESERNAALLDWYGARRRDLPWRNTTDPYLILVSEVMLQQTQVDRVVPFFERFVEAFPTVDDLAAATFTQIVGLWTGLGYNSRAKRLQETARLVAANGWPTTVEGLATLPGVGPYTANAVACFAFGAQVAAVDTNLRRVLSRWHGDVLSGATLHEVAAANLAEDAATWNQAMMDLGATVCLARSAKCTECPVAAWCSGPGVYAPPRPQARFDGSTRQIRGAIVRHLVTGSATIDQLIEVTGFPVDHIDDALDGLIEDDIVVETDTGFELTD